VPVEIVHLPAAEDVASGFSRTVAQLPPIFRGVRVFGMKAREVLAFHGWCVWCFGGRS
jgi:hypothetical protein